MLPVPVPVGRTIRDVRSSDRSTCAGERSAAVAVVLRECGRGWPLLAALMRLPVIRNVAEVGYGLVARNRHRLPGPAACAIDSRPQ